MGPQTFDAYVPIVNDPAILAAYKVTCQKIAEGYREPFSFGRIGTAAVRGAGSNAGAGAINPLIPLAGAAGAAGSMALDAAGILSDKQRRVFVRCLTARGEKSGAFEVMDPN